MMTDTIKNLGSNLTFLRKSRGLTQIQLAKTSGIPRATLSYIESGQGNPSLKVLVTLSLTLGISIEELLASPRPSCLLIKSAELKQQVRAHGKAIKTILLPDPIPGLQFERLSLNPHASMIGTPHSNGTKEYFTCTHGRIAIFVDGVEYVLNAGDVLAFPGNLKHSYHNKENVECQGISIVVLQ